MAAYLYCLSQGSVTVPAIRTYPTVEMSSAMPDTYGRPLKISLIFFWNMSPAGATANLNLPHLDANMVKYEDLYHILGCNTLNWHQL